MSNFKIALITTSFNSNGIGNYSKKLYTELEDLDTCFEFEKIIIDSKNKKIIKENEEIKIPVSVSANDMVFAYFAFKQIETSEYDLFHILHQSLSFLNLQPKIVTCHDLISLTWPQRPWDRILGKVYYSGLNEAEEVIAISKSTENDLKNIYGIKSTKICQGVDQNFRELDSEKYEIREKLDLNKNKNYILHVGSEEKRKNIETLVKAIEQTEIDCTILRVGSPGIKGLRSSIKLKIESKSLESQFKFLGRVSEERLVDYYNAADVFVFPSLYEGFGLPPLEAMACGTPVITSNTSSLPEVVGEAGITVDPKDEEQLAKEIEKVLKTPELQEKMKEKGLERAEKFSWEKTAKKTVEAYKEVIK